MRQAGGANDHPASINFLQLYKLLSTYKLIKPPKNGNCTVFEDQTLISGFTKDQFTMIFKKKDNLSYKKMHVNKIVEELKKISPLHHEEEEIIENIERIFLEETSQPENSNENSADDVDCIVFYMCGFVCRSMKDQLSKRIQCQHCMKIFKPSESSMFLPCAKFVHIANRGGLIYVERLFYEFFLSIENYFQHFVAKKKK